MRASLRVVERAVIAVIALILTLLVGILIAIHLSLPSTAQQASTHVPPQAAPPSPLPSSEVLALLPVTPSRTAPPIIAATPGPSPTRARRRVPRPSVLPTGAPAALTSVALKTSAPRNAEARIMLPGRFEAEDYDEGGEGVGYHDRTNGNEGGAYRQDDVDIERCEAGSPCYDVAWIGPGEWLAYTVHVSSTASYVFRVRVATPHRTARFHVEVNGVDITGSLRVPQSGGYDRWRAVVSKPVRLRAGAAEVRLVAETDGFNWDSVVVAPAPPQ